MRRAWRRATRRQPAAGRPRGRGRPVADAAAPRRPVGAALPLAAALLLVALLAALAVGACGGGQEVATAPAEPLVGRRFPSVVGEALSGAAVRLPEDFAGAPVLVVVAPAGEAQEDADRYLVSLRSRGVAFVETPVLASLVTRLTQRYHTGKLKETEPRDMWGRIVPLYKDGAVLAGFIGEVEDEARAIVLVLDRDGVIRFLDDGGYAAATLEAAVAAYESLRR